MTTWSGTISIGHSDPSFFWVNCVKRCSDQAKANAKVKTVFDICCLFFDLFCLILVFFAFDPAFAKCEYAQQLIVCVNWTLWGSCEVCNGSPPRLFPDRLTHRAQRERVDRRLIWAQHVYNMINVNTHTAATWLMYALDLRYTVTTHTMIITSIFITRKQSSRMPTTRLPTIRWTVLGLRWSLYSAVLLEQVWTRPWGSLCRAAGRTGEGVHIQWGRMHHG